MKRRSFISALLLTIWIPVLTTAVAVGIQFMRNVGASTDYVAQGRVIVGARGPGDSVSTAPEAEFYGTHMEIIESRTLQARALDRVRSLHPDRKEVDVKVRVSRAPGSAIFNVGAVGSEPSYTRLYLDALLDEYVALEKEMFDRSIGSGIGKVIDEVLNREKKLNALQDELRDFERAHDPALLSAEHERLIKKTTSLRDGLDELKKSAPDEAKMKALLESLEEVDKARKEVWDKAAAHLALQGRVAEAKHTYDAWKGKLESLDSASLTSRPMVAIMERPNSALPEMHDLSKDRPMWAAVGFGLGVVIMFIVAALWSSMSRTVQPPPLS